MSKVGIIIPVYNAENTLKRCIDSIINNTYKDIEILLINDGSIDNSINILREYEKKYNNIKVIDKKNEGVAKTRNLGISKINSEYIMFIDNDDYIDNDYIEKFVNIIIKEDCDVVYGGYRRENKEKKVIEKKRLIDSYFSRYIIVAPWAKIYKKEFLIKNKIEFLSSPIGEDNYFTLELISKKANIKFTDYIGYVWYYNEESVSNTKQRGIKKEIDIIKLLDNERKLFKELDIYTKYYFYRYCVWYLLFSGRTSDKDSFMKAYKKYYKWLKENNCYKVLNPFSRKLKAEDIKTRLAVFTFKILDKMNLMNLFAKIYCKGGNAHE